MKRLIVVLLSLGMAAITTSVDAKNGKGKGKGPPPHAKAYGYYKKFQPAYGWYGDYPGYSRYGDYYAQPIWPAPPPYPPTAGRPAFETPPRVWYPEPVEELPPPPPAPPY